MFYQDQAKYNMFYKLIQAISVLCLRWHMSFIPAQTIEIRDNFFGLRDLDTYEKWAYKEHIVNKSQHDAITVYAFIKLHEHPKGYNWYNITKTFIILTNKCYNGNEV